MKRQRTILLAAAGMAAAAALAACGGSGNTDPEGTSAGYNAALKAVVNPSSHKGGTIIFDSGIAPDSTDPGNTYSGDMWNVIRLYGRTLVTYRSAPGAAGVELVPDLATGLGRVSGHGLTWTYHLKPGITYEDGTTVTSRDVKYAVERTYARGVLPNGPSYFTVLLKDPGYRGPYKDTTPGNPGLTSVETPDPATIVFHLQRPFADFDYVAALPQTVPVPPGKDTGANYQLHPLSTGPYRFAGYQLDKRLTLVPNPHWDPATDPNRSQLAGKIVVNLNIGANMIGSNLIHGFAQVDLGGTGMQASTRAQILTSPSLKRNADSTLTDLVWFTSINTKVKPLDNVHCRRAVEYAADKAAFQTAWGGPVAGGDIASTAMPPNLVGYQRFDLYEAATKPHGDLAKAKQELAACGQPGGFSTTMAYRADSPGERAAAAAEQQALSRADIELTLQGYPSAKFFTNFVGVPNYVHQNGLGLAISGWGPDWPDGFGFLYYLTAGAAIRPAGNYNISELNDPVVNGLFTKALATTDTAARTRIWSQIDRQVMSDAVIRASTRSGCSTAART
jgi:peptide/nickel transport system substrate-binding protein